MKNFIVGLLMCVVVALQGCAADGTSTIGDGKIDPVEAATIQLVVGVTMANYPDTIMPAFQVTSALMALKTSDAEGIIALSVLDAALAKETAKLNLDPLTLQSFNELVVLVKANLAQLLDAQGLLDEEKLVMAWQVVDIVNATAKSRIGLIKK